MVSDLYRIKFFFKELDKSAEYLELYGVKVAVVSFIFVSLHAWQFCTLFYCCPLNFFQKMIFKIILITNTIRVSNSLDPD